MGFTDRLLKTLRYAVTIVAVLAALGAFAAWVEAVYWWGDTYAFAEALTYTVVTLVFVSLNAGIEKVESRVV